MNEDYNPELTGFNRNDVVNYIKKDFFLKNQIMVYGQIRVKKNRVVIPRSYFINQLFNLIVTLSHSGLAPSTNPL